MSNSLDPVRARQNVGPDLGPSCLQRLSADDTSNQRVNYKLSQQAQSLEFMLHIIPYIILRHPYLPDRGLP